MNRLPAQLAALQAALVPPSGSGPVPAALHSDIDALIRAIRRKRRFVEMHMALLIGIDWNQIDELGRRSSGVTDPTRLRIPLSEASLIIEHPGAVIDHVFVEKPCATNTDDHVRRGGCSGGGCLPTRRDRRDIGEPSKPHHIMVLLPLWACLEARRVQIWKVPTYACICCRGADDDRTY